MAVGVGWVWGILLKWFFVGWHRKRNMRGEIEMHSINCDLLLSCWRAKDEMLEIRERKLCGSHNSFSELSQNFMKPRG